MITFASIIKGQLAKTGLGTALAGFRRLQVAAIVKAAGKDVLRQVSANALLSQLKGYGLGVRRQWFLREIKYLRESADQLDRQAETAYDELLRTEDMPESKFKLSHEYSYQVSLEVMGYAPYEALERGPEGEERTQKYFFASNALMTPEQVEASFEAKFRSTTMTKVKANWGSLKFVKGFRRGPDI